MSAKKMYTRVVMDMTQDDMPVIASESCDYDGPWALCYDPGDGGRSSPANDGFSGRAGSGSSRGSAQTNASGFGLTSPMGGDFGDPGGHGYHGAARSNEARGIGDGYDGGWGLDAHSMRDMLQAVTDEDEDVIDDAKRMARINDPNPSFKDTVLNALDLGWSGLKGLFGLASLGTSAMAGPAGVLSSALSFGRYAHGMLEDQANISAYREAAGLPSLSPDMGMTETDPDQGETGVQTASAAGPAKTQSGFGLEIPPLENGIFDSPAPEVDAFIQQTQSMLAGLSPDEILATLDETWEAAAPKIKRTQFNAGFQNLLDQRKGA